MQLLKLGRYLSTLLPLMNCSTLMIHSVEQRHTHQGLHTLMVSSASCSIVNSQGLPMLTGMIMSLAISLINPSTRSFTKQKDLLNVEYR
jgi:hypothetical protein